MVRSQHRTAIVAGEALSGRHFLFSVGDGNLPFSKYGVQGFVLGAIITAYFGAVKLCWRSIERHPKGEVRN